MTWGNGKTKTTYLAGIYDSHRRGYLGFLDAGKFITCQKRAETSLKYFQKNHPYQLEIKYTKIITTNYELIANSFND